jgi:hypothetical protein
LSALLGDAPLHVTALYPLRYTFSSNESADEIGTPQEFLGAFRPPDLGKTIEGSQVVDALSFLQGGVYSTLPIGENGEIMNAEGYAIPQARETSPGVFRYSVETDDIDHPQLRRSSHPRGLYESPVVSKRYDSLSPLSPLLPLSPLAPSPSKTAGYDGLGIYIFNYKFLGSLFLASPLVSSFFFA